MQLSILHDALAENETMDRQFTFENANRMIFEHKELIHKLEDIRLGDSKYKKAISEATERYIADETLKLMADIPIEEVNRGKKGIRVKPLSDNGFKTYADVLTASPYQLSAIRGITEETAHTIKGIVSEAATKARKTTKLRLSADNKAQRATVLVVNIKRYQTAKALADEAASQYDQNYEDISSAIADIQCSTGFFKWLFSSKKKKQKAIDAYNYLQKMLSGEYGCAVRSLSSRNLLVESDNTVNVAWESFQNNPIQFTTVLEDVVPGVLGNNDAIYGLPEDLAREVQDESFFPDGLLCDLRRYQEWGVKYILHQGRVLLGDEMGLGKTIEAIATMVSLKNTGATHFVVVCPASVIINWCREIQKFSKLRVIKVHGDYYDRSPALKDWIQNGGVAVTTYETTAHFELPEDFKFTLLVVDEAHYIKNPAANRTRNTKEIAAHSERLLFMTGTALENNVGEMVNLIDVLQPTISRQISGMEMLSSAPQFRERIAPVYYRRKREDVLTELPELLENEEWCQLGSLEERAYEEAVLNGTFHDARRVSWNIDNLHYSSKANRMLEIIDEAKSEGRKVIVFSFYLDTLRKITNLLGDQCCQTINGSVPPARRQEIIDEFDKAPAGQVLPAQITAGGTGLNIQSASVVIICEPQIKPSIENQAISRAYRMGQARNVLVYRLLCENSVDEYISAKLAEKQAVFDAFADKSVAAENVELDKTTLTSIIQEEIDRINKKRTSFS